VHHCLPLDRQPPIWAVLKGRTLTLRPAAALRKPAELPDVHRHAGALQSSANATRHHTRLVALRLIFESGGAMLNERKEDFDDGEERVAEALENLTTEELRRLLAEIRERLRQAN
jgi:hypothetical protein